MTYLIIVLKYSTFVISENNYPIMIIMLPKWTYDNKYGNCFE